MTNRIVYHEHETPLNLFQLMELRCSGDSVLTSIYWIDAYAIKTEMHMRESDEKTFAFEYESSFTLTT